MSTTADDETAESETSSQSTPCTPSRTAALRSASRRGLSLFKNSDPLAFIAGAATVVVAVVIWAHPTQPGSPPENHLDAATHQTDVRIAGKDFHDKVAFIFPSTPLALIKPKKPLNIQEDLQSAFQWAHQNEGVDALSTTIAISITARTEEAVILEDFKIEVEKHPPLAGYGVQVIGQTGGDLDERYIEATIGDGSTDIRLRDYRGDGATDWKFPKKVSSTEPEYYFVTVFARNCYCLWTAKLFYTIRGESKTLIISDNGAKFRTSSYSATKASYTTRDGGVFTWCGGGHRYEPC